MYIYIYIYIYIYQLLCRSWMRHKVNFKTLTGLNLEFSFSKTGCDTKVKDLSLTCHLPIDSGRIIWFIPLTLFIYRFIPFPFPATVTIYIYIYIRGLDDQDTFMSCDQMRFIFQHSFLCSQHIYSISFAMLDSHLSK